MNPLERTPPTPLQVHPAKPDSPPTLLDGLEHAYKDRNTKGIIIRAMAAYNNIVTISAVNSIMARTTG